jgi:hypothetical protein
MSLADTPWLDAWLADALHLPGAKVALLADARRRAWVSDPAALEPAERALIEEALHD